MCEEKMLEAWKSLFIKCVTDTVEECDDHIFLNINVN